MGLEQFQPSVEGEARLLLLIAAFSRGSGILEGRTKLAKLDFLLRYPRFLERALFIRAPNLQPPSHVDVNEADMETRMVRYRYGPWDPSYFALLGRLFGKGLVQAVPFSRGIGYRVTGAGAELATRLAEEPAWAGVSVRVDILKRYFNHSGKNLKDFIYRHFPEVTHASWGTRL